MKVGPKIFLKCFGNFDRFDDALQEGISIEGFGEECNLAFLNTVLKRETKTVGFRVGGLGVRSTNCEEEDCEYKSRRKPLLLNTGPYHRDRLEVAGNVPENTKLNGLNELKRLNGITSLCVARIGIRVVLLECTELNAGDE